MPTCCFVWADKEELSLVEWKNKSKRYRPLLRSCFLEAADIVIFLRFQLRNIMRPQKIFLFTFPQLPPLFLPRDAKRGIATLSHPSARLSVCLSDGPSDRNADTVGV